MTSVVRLGLALLALLAATASADAPPSSTPAPGVLDRWLPDPVLLVEGRPRYVLVVEKDRQLLHLFRYDGQAELVASYPCTTGQNTGDKSVIGDLKTPEGVYFFTNHLTKQDLVSRYGPAASLYGAGAFPMDYPNFFDREEGRKGSGIWLHGVEYEGRVQKAHDTRGCVAVGNDDFRELASRIELGETPIIVTRTLRWADRENMTRVARQVQDALEGWKDAWQSKDIEAYIRHYAPDFHSRGMDRDAWRAYKDRFNRIYKTIEVDLEDVAVLRESEDLVLVDFRQNYVSDRYHDDGFKRLYLKQMPDGWKIWGESFRPLRVERFEPPAPTLVAEAQVERKASAPPPPVAEPEPAAAGGVSLSGLRLDRRPGSLGVSFVLDNEGDEPVAGYLTLAALDGDGKVLGYFPRFDNIRRGAPADYRRGDWYFAERATSVKAEVPAPGGGPATLGVWIYRRDGRLLLHEEHGP